MNDLTSFERAAYARAPDRVARLITALRDLTTGELVDDAARPDAPANATAMLRRMAAAAMAVLADPETVLQAGEIDRLLPIGSTLVQMFDIAGIGGLDAALRVLGDLPPGSSGAQVVKRLILVTLDSQIGWREDMLLRTQPRLGQQLLAHLIATKPVMTLHGEARRERLLELAPSFQPAEIPLTVDHLVLFARAWMLCSYAAGPKKHAIKRLFNQTLRTMAAGWGLHDVPLPAERPMRERPVLLFAAEIMHAQHVQYRYFGQYLRQLRKRFELVLLTEKREADAQASALFDRVLTFERGSTPAYLADIHRMIAETAPDILFYPSVGMRHWGPLFANLRLAPIQMTALGHSASTFCETIDYYLLEQGYVSDPALFGESVITVPDDSLIFERAPHYMPVAPEVRSAPDVLRIALPSNALKLNPTFLSVIARIGRDAKRPIEFHLLPNASGLEIAAIRIAVQHVLPGAHVHEGLAYPRYLETLSSCDLNLSPFPFGGLHSVIDSLRQGLPVVAMDCPEPHGRTDAMLLRRLGMPEWLIAKDIDGYVAAALRIIGDDALRVELSRQALALDIDGVMFGDGTTPLRDEVGDAVWWLYEHHEAARADGRKSWSQKERQTFSAGRTA